MDINNIYISDDIFDIIFNNLSFNEMINLSHTNKFLYNKYKNKIKINIYSFVNKDYKLFRECIHRYNYDELYIKTLGIFAVSYPNILWTSNMTGIYDLRFIFELIMKDLNINEEDIVNANKSYNIRFLLQRLNRCKSFNRFETINNINEDGYLKSLEILFRPKSPYIISNKNIQNYKKMVSGETWLNLIL